MPVTSVKNLGDPLLLTDFQFAGVSAEAAQSPGYINVWTRLGVTSDQPLFHSAVANLADIFRASSKTPDQIQLDGANSVLVVAHADRTAHLWIDTAATKLTVISRRPIGPGEAVYESQIADVVGLSFPAIEFKPSDRILYLFRVDWHFALYFDVHPDGDLDLDNLKATLGRLYRTLRYRRHYEAIGNPKIYGALRQASWFPFVEILGHEFNALADCVESGFDLGEAEQKLVAAFDGERLQGMLSRWLAKPHFARRESLLRQAVDSFARGADAAVIKIVITEIEGVLRDAYRNANGPSKSSLNDLLAYAQATAERRVGEPDTLLMSAGFAQYLREVTFGRFDLDDPEMPASASSRHAVGHGAATADSYTRARALQSLLTLDQVFFHT